ncbi:MAG: hypothetical protein IKB25_13940 [Lentisphaeria bacterium]|nr:hypothetical protein [Lentisphaeria bacterium]
MKKILLTALIVGGTFAGAFAHGHRGHHRHHGFHGHRPPPPPVFVRPLPPPRPVVVVNPVYPSVYPLVRPVVVPVPSPVIVTPPYRYCW